LAARLQRCSQCWFVGFSAKELGRVVKLVREHRENFMEAWHDFFGI